MSEVPPRFPVVDRSPEFCKYTATHWSSYMARKLASGIAKNKPDWTSSATTAHELLHHLHSEIGELLAAQNSIDRMHEAADVANLAFMYAEHLNNGWSEQPDQGGALLSHKERASFMRAMAAISGSATEARAFSDAAEGAVSDALEVSRLRRRRCPRPGFHADGHLSEKTPGFTPDSSTAHTQMLAKAVSPEEWDFLVQFARNNLHAGTVQGKTACLNDATEAEASRKAILLRIAQTCYCAVQSLEDTRYDWADAPLGLRNFYYHRVIKILENPAVTPEGLNELWECYYTEATGIVVCEPVTAPNAQADASNMSYVALPSATKAGVKLSIAVAKDLLANAGFFT